MKTEWRLNKTPSLDGLGHASLATEPKSKQPAAASNETLAICNGDGT